MNQKTVGNNSLQLLSAKNENHLILPCITDFEVKEICFTLHC